MKTMKDSEQTCNLSEFFHRSILGFTECLPSTRASDPMGSVTFYFSDPIIKSYQYSPYSDIFKGYSVGSGYMEVMLLPRPI